MSGVATIKETKAVNSSATINNTQILSNDFRSILDSAITASPAQRLPTDAEKLGMMRNWEMTFADDFPKDLKQKLEKMYSETNTISEKWDFANMFDGTFQRALGGDGFPSWGSDWRSRLSFTIQSSQSLVGSLDIAYQNNAKMQLDKLQSLLS